MNVIIVSPSLNPKENVSGISSVTQFIISNNKDVNYIHFLLGRKDNEKGGLFRLSSIFKSIIKWNRLLSLNKNAIIHYNFPLSKASIIRDPIFILIALIKKRKILIHLHGGLFLTATKIPFLYKTILNYVFSFNIPLIVLSNKEKELVKIKFNCKNTVVLPNCIELNDAFKFQKETNLNNKLTLGYLGRIVNTKGMEYLLEACVELKRMNIPFVLRIAGKEDKQGEFIPKFNNLLGEDFIYEGVVYDDNKLSFIKGLDIFILPSFFEGLPMSLIECMSYGVVPITTNVGSISEIVQNNFNGLFIDVKDSTSIINQISKLHSNRTLLNYLSTNARSYVFRHFNQENYIKTLNNLYSKSYV